jgi:hypothetical protein
MEAIPVAIKDHGSEVTQVPMKGRGSVVTQVAMQARGSEVIQVAMQELQVQVQLQLQVQLQVQLQRTSRVAISTPTVTKVGRVTLAIKEVTDFIPVLKDQPISQPSRSRTKPLCVIHRTY